MNKKNTTDSVFIKTKTQQENKPTKATIVKNKQPPKKGGCLWWLLHR